MKVTFDDLFDSKDAKVVAKKDIRIGALVIPNGHSIDPNDPNLGLAINDWRDKSFEVTVDNNTISIQQIIEPNS